MKCRLSSNRTFARGAVAASSCGMHESHLYAFTITADSIMANCPRTLGQAHADVNRQRLVPVPLIPPIRFTITRSMNRSARRSAPTVWFNSELI
jgi:hypothetical protein